MTSKKKLPLAFWIFIGLAVGVVAGLNPDERTRWGGDRRCQKATSSPGAIFS